MSKQEILDLFARTEGDPYTTSEVAKEVQMSKKAANVYLSTLEVEGLPERRPGDEFHTAVWSLTDAGQEAAPTDGIGR